MRKAFYPRQSVQSVVKLRTPQLSEAWSTPHLDGSSFCLSPLTPAGAAGIPVRLRKQSTLSVEAIAAWVDLDASKSANARPHKWMGYGKPTDIAGTLQLGL
jgi:hypothetical protein